MSKPEAPPADGAPAPLAAQPAGSPRFSGQQSAVALTYSGKDAAPRVVAKGRGLVAEAIIERAHQHGIYVHESKELVALLIQVDLDQRIPPELYRAVAELLVWVYQIEQREPGSEPAPERGLPAHMHESLRGNALKFAPGSA